LKNKVADDLLTKQTATRLSRTFDSHLPNTSPALSMSILSDRKGTPEAVSHEENSTPDLLSLPAEVRILMYKFLFSSLFQGVESKLVSEINHERVWIKKPAGYLDLVLTCRQIYHEATDVVYANTAFRVITPWIKADVNLPRVRAVLDAPILSARLRPI